jgi:uncharacterized membrane protein YeiH
VAFVAAANVADDVLHLPLWLDLAAVSVGAVFGSLIARNRRLDFMGVLVVGTLMALGGGMLRDILLGQIPIALRNQWYLPTAVVALILTQLFAQLFARPRWFMLALDAVFLALFTIIGVEKALAYGLTLPGSVFVGVIAGTGGGLLGDLVSGVRPVIVSPGGPLYASIALGGAVVYEAVHGLGGRVWAEAIAFIFIVVLRLLSYARGWTGVAVDEFAPDFTPVIAKPVRRAANKMQRGRASGRQTNTDDGDDDGPTETAPLSN